MFSFQIWTRKGGCCGCALDSARTQFETPSPSQVILAKNTFLELKEVPLARFPLDKIRFAPIAKARPDTDSELRDHRDHSHIIDAGELCLVSLQFG